MKEIRWSEEKNEWLKNHRNISFDQVEKLIKQRKFVGDINHPNQDKHPGQSVFLVEVDKYIYSVPYVEESDYIFLKTIHPSRKYTKQYLKK